MAVPIRVVDSHTGGEPTRVVIGGMPPLEGSDMVAAKAWLATEYDSLRRSVVGEPRCSDVVVGAYLWPPEEGSEIWRVVFFNNAGYLCMCGHGTVGIVETLRYLNRIDVGRVEFATPAGAVAAWLLPDGQVSFDNVPCWRSQAAVEVNVPSYGPVTGDIAYGGNWFFLIGDSPVPVIRANLTELQAFTVAVRQSLDSQGVTGDDGAQIDHIEVFGSSEVADSRNYVLCPGLEYDRSPCGTGTSAKVACLAADGKLAPGQVWRQESIVGSVFEARYRIADGHVVPTITGRAHIVGDGIVVVDEDDPFKWGIP
ncbi:MAG: proline racemase family protein [Armatimonadetes bacterium]|nr:proline racemase family protein [Armatimonadota bacterium]